MLHVHGKSVKTLSREQLLDILGYAARLPCAAEVLATFERIIKVMDGTTDTHVTGVWAATHLHPCFGTLCGIDGYTYDAEGY